MIGKSEYFRQVVEGIQPTGEYQGLKIYNICHIINALVAAGMTSCTTASDYAYRNMLVEEAVEILDAVVYSFPKYECSYTEAVELTIHSGKRAFVLEDLS